MNQKIKDAVMASFVADALSLGVHWVYDVAAIESKYGRLEQMVEPELAEYHKGKPKGALTHYGDQAYILLKSVSEHKGFDSGSFRQAWCKLFEDYSGYIDGATKDTLNNIKNDKTIHVIGSMSSDLGGAARISPLALVFHNNLEGFISAAEVQTAMTHNHPVVIETARYFARVAVNVFEGRSPVESMIEAMDQIPENSPVSGLVSKGLDSKGLPTRQTISQFGQMCSVDVALPSTIHLIASYEDDLKTALIENIMAGGDSSARGLLAGFILGAYLGLDQIPDQWLADMKARYEIGILMDNIS